MKAVICKAFGPPETLAFEDVEPPALEPGSVRIAVHATGVNFPDLLLIEGKYQVRPPFPFSPGLECSGIVTECGPGVDAPAPGTRVLAYVSYGGMAEVVVAPAECVIPHSRCHALRCRGGLPRGLRHRLPRTGRAGRAR